MDSKAYMYTYIRKIKKIHAVILDFLNNNENDFNTFIDNISQYKISENRQEFKEILYLISRISANHNRTASFSSKIVLILLHFKIEIKSSFTNIEIFNIFDGCKKMLLFLFKEKIIIPDRLLFKIITDNKHKRRNYPEYFYPEFKNFYSNPIISETIELFNEKREIGENENYICQLIRNDSIDEFIVYINKNNISVQSFINNSIFETNPLLIGSKVSLIEYAAFFGSIQIFQYLKFNYAKLTPFLWICAIHGKNPDLFHLLEENHIEIDSDMKHKCLKEAIKCHHNEFVKYIQNNFFNNFNENDSLIENIKYRNFLNMPDKICEYSQFFFNFVKNDYPEIVEFILNKFNIDVNATQKKYLEFNRVGDRIKITNPSLIKDYYFIEEITPLCYAIKKGYKEIVQLLLKHQKIDINKKYIKMLYKQNECNEFKTPLFIAIENENLEIIKLLLKNKNILVNEESLSSRFSEREEMIDEKKQPLHLAVEKENIGILQCLLNKENLDINSIAHYVKSGYKKRDKSALHIAIEKDNVNMVQLLLSKNIDQGIDYHKYIFVDESDGIDHDEDIYIKSSLILAIEHKNMKIIELLLKNENDINKLDYEYVDYNLINKKSALHIAVENGWSDIVKLLLCSKKIDVNLMAQFKNKINGEYEYIIDKKTALFIAVEKNNLEITQILLSNEKINANLGLVIEKKFFCDKQCKSKTVLEFANENGNKEIIKAILKHLLLKNKL